VVQIDPAQGGDHLSAPTLAKLRKASTVIVAPEAVAKSVVGDHCPQRRNQDHLRRRPTHVCCRRYREHSGDARAQKH
jgi:hypothetical protein